MPSVGWVYLTLGLCLVVALIGAMPLVVMLGAVAWGLLSAIF